MKRLLRLLLLGFFIRNNFGLASAPSVRNLSRENEMMFSPRRAGKSLAQCLGQSEIFKCLKSRIIQSLDGAIHDNSTWQISDFLEIDKNIQNISARNWDIENNNNLNGSFGDLLANKIYQLAKTRGIRLKVSPNLLFEEEGRKRKNKDKGGMMAVGGMAMVAMMAQMFLGKVLLISGAAFIMAKVALLFSVVTGLKKTAGGGGADHIIYESGHSSHGGWHRSLPRHVPETTDQIETNEHQTHSNFNEKQSMSFVK